MDVAMFGPRKDWGSVKGAFTKNAWMSLFGPRRLGFCKGCFDGECMAVVMFGSRKDWGSVKGALTENAWLSLCLVHVKIGVL